MKNRSAGAAWAIAGGAITLLLATVFLAAVARFSDWPARIVAALLFLPVPIVGFLICRRYPHNPYGWVWLLLGVAGGVLQWSGAYVEFGLERGGAPGMLAIGLRSGPAWIVTFWMFPFVMLLFPGGTLPSPRWRILAKVVIVAGATALLTGWAIPGELGTVPLENPLGIDGPVGTIAQVLLIGGVIALLLAILPAAISLFVRYRSATGTERMQLKWFAWAGGSFVAVYVLDWFWEAPGAWESLKEGLPIALLPVAIGVAVLRHGLYDIDRLISRTVSYGLVTATLVGVYVLTVFALQSLVGVEGDIPVAASTLLVAGVFDPLRRRVQSGVDRHFNRARYDAVRTVEGFSRQLRSEVALAQVSSDLCDVAAVTLTLFGVALAQGGRVSVDLAPRHPPSHRWVSPPAPIVVARKAEWISTWPELGVSA
ncbi:hypothetical protein BH23ACT5_BH23ACT5_17300 [soil metagenome]